MAQRVLAFLHRTHLLSIGLALLIAVVAVGAYSVLGQDRSVRTVTEAARLAASARQAPSSIDAATPMSSTVPSAGPTTGLTTQVRSVFFGDAIVAGANVGDGKPSFVDVATRELGWGHADFGFPGSGFTTAGTFTGGRDYLARIQQLRGYNIDVLVLEGGANDGAADPATLRAKVQAVLDVAQALVPTAKIVLMGPWAPSDTPTPAMIQTNEVLRTLAEAAKLPYIDPIDEKWISGSYPGSGNAAAYISTDGFYPNAKGHEFFGQRVAEDLRRLLPASLFTAAAS